MLLRKTNDHGEKWIADEHTSSLVGQMKSELLEFEKSPEKEYQVLRSMAVFLITKMTKRSGTIQRNIGKSILKKLASNRWNTLNLIFSQQTSYLAPMYPFHIKVDQYPSLRLLRERGSWEIRPAADLAGMIEESERRKGRTSDGFGN